MLNNLSAVEPLWHIVGVGSLGTLAASRVLAAGFSLRVISRQPSVQRTILWPDGRHWQSTLTPAADESIQRLIVAVKAGDTAAALAPLLPQLDPHCHILRLQNGMGSLDTISLPPQARRFHLLTTDGAWREGNQVHVVAENCTLIGDGLSQPPSWFMSLAAYWPGLQWCEDIDRAQRQKLAVNAVINPLTALYGCHNGALLDGGPREAAMQALAEEVDAVLARMDESWPMDTLARSRQVAANTAANTSSMLADVQAGRTTEIDYINGYVLRLAAAQGMALPAHQRCYEQISVMDRATIDLGGIDA